GRPPAITDNLNFGNPERPEIMGQFVGCLKGISEACRVLDFPVVSGNVSLYNETNGRGILPTPSIGGVGLLDDFTKSATLAFKAADEAILLIGETHGWLGQSVYLRYIVTVPAAEADRVLAKMKGADVPCARIGTTGGDAIAIADETPVSVASLKAGFEGWFPAYMEGKIS